MKSGKITWENFRENKMMFWTEVRALGKIRSSGESISKIFRIERRAKLSFLAREEYGVREKEKLILGS